MNINAEIRAELARQRLTYADLAERLGTTRQNIWRKLTSERTVHSDDLVLIANVLDVPASELMRRAEHSEVAA